MQRRSSSEEFCQEEEQRNAMVGGRPRKAWLPNTTAEKTNLWERSNGEGELHDAKKRRGDSRRKASEWVKVEGPQRISGGLARVETLRFMTEGGQSLGAGGDVGKCT